MGTYGKHRESLASGHLVLLLHAHLPYCLFHGKWPHGSDWLAEAACETYIPLLNVIRRLAQEGKRPGLTIDLTPILCEMLASDEFKRLLKAYIEEKREAAAADRRQSTADGEEGQAALAGFWEEFYRARLDDFTDTYQEDLLSAFRGFQERGLIELITSAATHAYLPLLDCDASISAQVGQGVKTYRSFFGREPQGIWLPECGYRPFAPPSGNSPERQGIESILADHGLGYFFLDGHHLSRGYATDSTGEGGGYGAVTGEPVWAGQAGGSEYRFTPDHDAPDACETVYAGATSEGQGDAYRVYRTGRQETGECAFFARDGETSRRVWSSTRGYPGDPWYLEFHKKHTPGGLRYWRITDREGDLGGKLPYDPLRAQERVRKQARHFRDLVEGKLQRYRARAGRPGVMTLPFDAELFGHWWFEGVDWLYEVVSAFHENCATMISQASRVLSDMPPADSVQVREGSWGQGGGHHTWHNKETAWTWDRIRQAERHMLEAVKSDRDGFSGRVLRQMARELFLMQSSDWQFLITTGTAGDYGRSRFSGHHEAFEALRRMLAGYAAEGTVSDGDMSLLSTLEETDAVFQDISLKWFRSKQP